MNQLMKKRNLVVWVYPRLSSSPLKHAIWLELNKRGYVERLCDCGELFVTRKSFKKCKLCYNSIE